jgi:hypothetical protein
MIMRSYSVIIGGMTSHSGRLIELIESISSTTSEIERNLYEVVTEVRMREAGRRYRAQRRLNELKREAERGDSWAQLRYAAELEFSVRDYVKAYGWYNVAARSGRVSDLAIKARDRVAMRMTPNQIAEAERAAAEWLEMHPLPAN